MAYIGMNFNAADIEPNTALEVIPAGKYHVQIVNSEMRETKSGGGQYLWLELSIMDGPYADRRLFDRLNLANPNEKAVEIAQRTLSAICHATGQMAVSDSEQLHNRSMIVDVRVKPAGVDKNGIYRESSNEIGKYLPMNDAQQPAPPMRPAPAAPAAPAAHATPQPTTPPWRRATATA
jgi:hypothetical protein